MAAEGLPVEVCCRLLSVSVGHAEDSLPVVAAHGFGYGHLAVDKRGHDPVLALDIVCTGQDVAVRGAAQDPAGRPVLVEQIGDIALAAGDPRGREVAHHLGVSGQPVAQCSGVAHPYGWFRAA